MDKNPKRKLSAIVFTDIVGFTELSARFTTYIQFKFGSS